MTVTFCPTASSSSSRARTATLNHADRPSGIATPCLWPNTQRGILPTLTLDALLPSEKPAGVLLSLEHLLDERPPLYLRSPSEKATIASHFGYESLAEDGPLILLSVKDPARLTLDSIRGTSGDEHVGVHTTRGYSKLSHQEFVKTALTGKHTPDLLIAMSDEPDDPSPSKKRLRKSIQRSLRWASEAAASSSSSSSKPALLVQLVGSDNIDARRAFVQDLVDDEELALDERVFGYVFRLPPLSRAMDAETMATLCKASLDLLPSNKLRMALIPTGPGLILRLVRELGVDVFVEDVADKMADAGVALDFDFDCDFGTLPAESPQRDVGVNLYDPSFAQDLVPLSTSALAATSTNEQPVTRAYVHHLLAVHELSAHILLSLHNGRVMAAFMHRVRDLISKADGSFERQCDAFAACYHEPTPGELAPCLAAGLQGKAAVNSERGKGRDKGKA